MGPFAGPVRTVVPLLGALLGLYLCWLIIRPFRAVIIWALALAVIARPGYHWLERRMRPTPAALLAVVSAALICVAPAVFITEQLFQQGSIGLAALSPHLTSDQIHASLQNHPFLAGWAEQLKKNLNLDEDLRRAAGTLTAKASGLVRSSIWLIAQLCLTFVTLFYFLRDRDKLLDLLRLLVPLSEEQATRLFDHVAQTISACLYGNFIVKLVQGVLGGLMFWILGLPLPILCGAAMALFAVVPVLGTALVWGPFAIYLALAGSWGKALILSFWGALVVGMIDNVLYPILVAGELRFHTLALFFFVLGGLIAFGFTGVILGPVILAVVTAFLEVWRLQKGYNLEPAARSPVVVGQPAEKFR